MLDFKVAKLSNGLRIITAPLEGTRAATILFLIATGSRYETKSENGLAHFLEHMFFKGTQKRNNTVDIARDLDSIGANYNAFTGEEYTGYFVSASNEQFDLSLDVLTDMLYNSLFNPEEIEKEKGVILEEVNMIKDMPQAYVNYVAKELLWPNQPLGRIITGEKETVTKFTRQDFIKFRERFYRPENMVVVVAGGAGHKDWLGKLEKVLGDKAQQSTPKAEAANSSQSKPALKISYKKTDQAHFILGFRALKRTDKRQPVLKVLNNIMGATMSSRLFIEVRERRGLCYYISSDIDKYADAGFWGVSAGVDIKRFEEAVKVILEQFNRLKNELVEDEELNRAKENLKGKLYLRLEESMNVAEFLAERELLDTGVKDPDELINEFEQVTKEDIQNLANDMMKAENLNLAVVGPFEKENSISDIINKF